MIAFTMQIFWVNIWRIIYGILFDFQNTQFAMFRMWRSMQRQRCLFFFFYYFTKCMETIHERARVPFVWLVHTLDTILDIRS